MTGPRLALAGGSRLLRRELTLRRVLTGGQHATTILVSDGTESFVVRLFPDDDPAVEREVLVLERIAALGDHSPRSTSSTAPD